MNYQYEEIDKHIQWLIKFMKEEYPNNYELIIDSNSGTIRSNLQAQVFLREDLKNPVGFKKAIEKPLSSFFDTLAKVAEDEGKNALCSAWESCDHYAICNGIKEPQMCHCGGDVKKCDFYPEKRKKDK